MGIGCPEGSCCTAVDRCAVSFLDHHSFLRSSKRLSSYRIGQGSGCPLRDPQDSSGSWSTGAWGRAIATDRKVCLLPFGGAAQASRLLPFVARAGFPSAAAGQMAAMNSAWEVAAERAATVWEAAEIVGWVVWVVVVVVAAAGEQVVAV